MGESRLGCSPNESFNQALGSSEARVALPGCLRLDERGLVFFCLRAAESLDVSCPGKVVCQPRQFTTGFPDVGDRGSHHAIFWTASTVIFGGVRVPSPRMGKHGVRNGQASLIVAIVQLQSENGHRGRLLTFLFLTLKNSKMERGCCHTYNFIGAWWHMTKQMPPWRI